MYLTKFPKNTRDNNEWTYLFSVQGAKDRNYPVPSLPYNYEVSIHISLMTKDMKFKEEVRGYIRSVVCFSNGYYYGVELEGLPEVLKNKGFQNDYISKLKDRKFFSRWISEKEIK